MVGALTSKFVLHGAGIPADAQVVSYRATEQLSRPFEIEVAFCTEDAGFDAAQLLRQRVLLEVVNERGEQRFFDGMVESGAFTKIVVDKFHFHLLLQPSLQALAHRENSRIFQEISIVDVVKQLFSEAGIDERVEWKLSGTYPAREYIVQYRESTLNFVHRLFEQVGIFYFFTHDAEGHTLVIGDDPSVFDEGGDPVPFSMGQGTLAFGEPLEHFSRRRSLRTNSALVRDYDFRNPQVKPEAHVPAQERWPMPYYEYPAGFIKSADGQLLAKRRMAANRRDADVASGRSRAIGLRCGGRLTVDGVAEACLNGEFVVTRLATFGKQELGGEASDNVACMNTFDVIPAGLEWAPPREARVPRISGVQTAVVTGAEQEDQSIHTDEFGRIKVRFYWDREGQYDANSSCWMRVSQVPMGGSMILPRVGWEVSVSFLDGDPDRPVVVGRVYNAEATPPAALPDNKASGSLKSMSSPGGGGCNEISVGDSGGSQGFSIKAQKDLNMSTGYDCTEEVGVDDEHHVNANVSRTVKVNDTETVGADQALNVGANLSSKITGSQTQSIGGNDDYNATGNFVENIGGSRSYTVGGNQMTICNGEQRTIQGPISRTVGAVQIVIAADSITENVLGVSSSTVGAARVHAVNGSHGEVVGGARSQTVAAAEIHMTSADFAAESGGPTTHLIGGVHKLKITGDMVVKAPAIALVGGSGTFKAGGTTLVLAGGPISMKGSKISVKAAMIKKTGGNMKMG